jgi:hypothetical protein
MSIPIELTLATLNNGDLLECATQELRKICQNIADPNVKTDAKRKLNITIEIKPDAKGQMAKIGYAIKSVMPGPDAGTSLAYIAMSPGSSVISLFEVESHPALFEEEATSNVTHLPAKRA